MFFRLSGIISVHFFVQRVDNTLFFSGLMSSIKAPRARKNLLLCKYL